MSKQESRIPTIRRMTRLGQQRLWASTTQHAPPYLKPMNFRLSNLVRERKKLKPRTRPLASTSSNESSSGRHGDDALPPTLPLILSLIRCPLSVVRSTRTRGFVGLFSTSSRSWSPPPLLKAVGQLTVHDSVQQDATVASMSLQPATVLQQPLRS